MRAAFRRLLRPGRVLNIDKAYVHKIEDFEWVAGAREAIKLCNDRGYLTFVVTNQAGVARGYYGSSHSTLHDWMSRDLAKIGAHIDEFQYCPYHEEGVVAEWRQASDRRKPAPGMILDCLNGWPVPQGIQPARRRQAARPPGRRRRRNNRASFRGRRPPVVHPAVAWRGRRVAAYARLIGPVHQFGLVPVFNRIDILHQMPRQDDADRMRAQNTGMSSWNARAVPQ